MGEDTLILGYGTGCGKGGPPRLKMPVNDGKVAPVLYEEDFGCGRRRRNIDEEVLAQLKKQVGGAASSPRTVPEAPWRLMVPPARGNSIYL